MAEIAENGRRMRAFYIHLALYGAVNLALAALALWQTPAGGPREYWFVWPLAGWGIGVAAHGLALWLKRLGAAGNSLFADHDVRGAAVHLFVYLAVNALLVVVNFAVTPDTIWFFWPLIGWGIGLAFHAWRVYRAVLKRTVEHYALEQRLIGEIAQERRSAGTAAAAKTRPAARASAQPAKAARGKAKPAAAKATASKPAATKRAAAKPPASKATSSKATSSKTTSSKATDAKTTAAKPAARKPAAAKSATPKRAAKPKPGSRGRKTS